MKSNGSRFAIFFDVLLTACLTLSMVAPASLPVQAQSAGGGPPPERQPIGKTSLQNLLNVIRTSAGGTALIDTASLEKLDSHVQDLVASHLSGQDVARAAAGKGLRLAHGQDLLVDVYINGPLTDASSQLSRLGMQVLATNAAFGGMVEGYLPVESVLQAAGLSSTRAILPVAGAVLNTGSVTSQGDAAHNGPAARLLGPTGSGIKVGIISDSINQVGTGVAGSQSSGDLPAGVTVMSDFPGGVDEGRAMAEVIYDTAPGITNIYFATGATGPAFKAAAINGLVANGVRVIADDITYLTEPFFQDGVVAQAVDNAYAAGVAYFAAAGNFARQSYESGYVDDGTAFHDHYFGPGSPPWLQWVTNLPNGSCFQLELQWDDGWGHVTHNFDAYLYNFSTVGTPLASGTANNIATGVPAEYVSWCNSTGSLVSLGLEIRKMSGSSSAYLKYIATKDSGTFSISQFDTASQAIGPDAASAAGAMTVAAVNWSDPGLNDAEPYSSRGPFITRFFSTAGVRLGSPIVRPKPNIAGADCVSTSNHFAGGGAFSGGAYCGTSAAAAVVAAIAALDLSANPALTPGGLYAILGNATNTIDCTTIGNPDADCGYGFVLADQEARNAIWSLPWYGSVSITASRNVVAVGRPHVGTQVTTYDSSASGSLTSFLPMLFKGAWGSYDSAFYIQNVDPSNTAHVTIKYFDTAGTLSCGPVADTIPPLSSHGTWVPSVSCLPLGWVGAAVITSSDFPIVTVGRPHVGAEVMTYNGFAAGSTISYLPMLFKNAFGGSYDSAFYIQNVDTTHSAHVTIKYYDTGGTLTCGPVSDTIPPLSSHGTWVPSVSCLPVGWVGGVVVTSSDYPIVAVGRPHIGTQVTTYDGFASGSLTSFLPMLFKNAFGGSYDSAFYIQNVDGSNSAHVTVKYYDTLGNLTCTKAVDTIPPLSSHGIWVPSELNICLPIGWVGSAVVTSSDFPIVAVGRPHIGAEVTAYDGFTAGSAPINVPMLFKGMWGNYNSALYIENTDGGGPASVTLKFYDVNGTLSCTRSDTIPALGTLGYWLPSVMCKP